MKAFNYELNQEFLIQFDRNANYVIHSINGDLNKKLFIQRCYDVVNEASRVDDIKLTRIIIQNYLKLAKSKKNGFFKFDKDVSRLAYTTALDVVDSIIRKRALQ